MSGTYLLPSPNTHCCWPSRMYNRKRKCEPHSKRYSTPVYGSRPLCITRQIPKMPWVLLGRQDLYMQNNIWVQHQAIQTKCHRKLEETGVNHPGSSKDREGFEWIMMTLKQREIDGQERNINKNQWLADGEKKKENSQNNNYKGNRRKQRGGVYTK